MGELFRAAEQAIGEKSEAVYKVEEFLGGGGQGEVYRATASGQPLALKWYFPASATPKQRKGLESLIRIGPPTLKFLWPIELVSAPRVAGFGYVMPLRPACYKGFVDLMKRRVEPTFRALATAGYELSDSFLQLHSKGLCYRDISFGNVFFDPTNGDVLICDNDNVGINGEEEADVLGTPRFMAPEIARGEASPSTQTDLFSLAVLLFYMLMLHHPLEGKREHAIKCLDLPAMKRLYGTEPLFIFDGSDRSNEPVPGSHDNALVFWPIYPKFIRELFSKAFTLGIRDPNNGRVRESEWRAAMVRLRDSAMYCPNCAKENLWDDKAPFVSCWSCKTKMRAPLRLRFGRDSIVINRDTKLFLHHIDDTKLYDFTDVVGDVTQHPRDQNVWGLRNLSANKWVSTAQGGSAKDVAPGKSVTLATGTRIHFGRTEGEIIQ